MYQLVAALIHAENFFSNSWGRNFFQMQLLKHQFMLVPPPQLYRPSLHLHEFAAN